MKFLDYIFFLIPVLNCALLYFSSSHTQTDRAPCNNKQYELPAFNFYCLLRKCVGTNEKVYEFIFDQQMLNNRFCN